MSKPITKNYVFQNQAGPIPLSELDSDFDQLFASINDFATYGNYLIDSSGAANSITATTPGGITFSYLAGTPLQIQVANSTTGAVTLNVNSLGAKAVVNTDGTPLTSGSIVAGQIVPLMYDGTSFRALVSLLSTTINGTFADGTAAAPGVRFTNNPSSGLFNVAGALGLSTNGVNRVTIALAGNITFAQPAGVALTVGSSANATIAAQLGSIVFGTGNQFGSNTAEMYPASGTEVLNIGTVGAAAVNFWTNGVARVGISAAGNVSVGPPSSGIALSSSDAYGTSQNVGWLDVPRVAVSSVSRTYALGDRGQFAYFNGAGITATLPANASVAFPIGSVVGAYNSGGSSITIACADTLNYPATGGTGSRTLGAGGYATMMKVDTTTWIITGVLVS